MLNVIFITILFALLFFILCKINLKNKDILKIVLTVIILEVYIFNFNSFRLKFRNYEKRQCSENEVTITDMDYNREEDTYTITGDNPNIEIKDLNIEIATVKIDAELINTNKISYNLLYTDDTSKNYRKLPSKVLVNDLLRSQYTTCYLSGESEKLQICFEGEQNIQIKINKIEINSEVPFNISIIRILVLSLSIILVYKMITSKTFNVKYSENNVKQNNILMIISILFIIITIWISITTPIDNDIYNEFTNSLINGKLSLQIEPSKELENLDNPYDITQRTDIEYLWDVAYYNNSYYVYFGILPALILFIPIKLLVGESLSTGAGVLLFSIFIIINLTRILIMLYKKWFKDVSFNYLVLSLIGTLSGSLIFWINRRPNIYELVISAGICFATEGFYLMFKAIKDDKIVYKNLFLGALSLSLAVACRPNLLLVSLVFLPELIKILIKNIREKENVLKFICSVGIPYLTVGILLMTYNYIRFDNFFEFGTSYQLTVNDMRNLKYRILTIPTGIITQLFKLPVTTNYFPYFLHQQETISFFGYYYVESLVCGLLVLNPINFILLFLIGLKRKIKEKEAYNYTCILVLVALIICIANITLAGSLQRYSMDYAWLLNISSYLTLFIIVKNIKSVEINKYILKIAIIITLFMLFINFIVGGVVSEHNLLERIYPNQYYNIRYDICFWE